MTNKHTLNTPWRIVSTGNNKFPDAVTIEDCKGGFPLVKDNSPEIVRVINSHNDLLKALDGILENCVIVRKNTEDKKDYRQIARAAINKAKGNQNDLHHTKPRRRLRPRNKRRQRVNRCEPVRICTGVFGNGTSRA